MKKVEEIRAFWSKIPGPWTLCPERMFIFASTDGGHMVADSYDDPEDPPGAVGRVRGVGAGMFDENGDAITRSWQDVNDLLKAYDEALEQYNTLDTELLKEQQARIAAEEDVRALRRVLAGIRQLSPSTATDIRAVLQLIRASASGEFEISGIESVIAEFNSVYP